MSASIVLGQSGFSAYEFLPPGPNLLYGPVGLALDASGDLYVTDIGGNRVDEFEPPFGNGMNASLDVGVPSPSYGEGYCGQPLMSLCMPINAILDSVGNLWVADADHGRVVEYQQPIQQAMAVNLAIGQPNLQTITNCDGGYAQTPVGESGYPASANATELCYPSAIAFDGNGDLWVADAGNGRVLEYTPPFSTGMAASLEIGYPVTVGMDSSYLNDCSQTPNSATAANLCGPSAIVFDAQGNLWVTDSNYNRVLRFDPPFTSGMSASLVLGQPDFTHGSAGATAADTLNDATGISFDADGDLIVADAGNGRVLFFVPPFTSGMSASVVVGQPDMLSHAGYGCGVPGEFGNPSASTFCKPEGVLAF